MDVGTVASAVGLVELVVAVVVAVAGVAAPGGMTFEGYNFEGCCHCWLEILLR